MAYESASEREKNVLDARARLEEVIHPFNRSAPRPFTDENADLYRKRTLPIVQQYAPNFQNVKVDDARGSAFDLLEKQIYDDARKESRRPTQIPEGQLIEMKRVDQSGRPFSEFFGSPKAWMKDFAPDTTKKLAGVIDNRSWQKI